MSKRLDHETRNRLGKGGPLPQDPPIDRGNYPPTAKQLGALQALAAEAGSTPPAPRTLREASVAISELKRQLGQHKGRKPRIPRAPRTSRRTRRKQ